MQREFYAFFGCRLSGRGIANGFRCGPHTDLRLRPSLPTGACCPHTDLCLLPSLPTGACCPRIDRCSPPRSSPSRNPPLFAVRQLQQLEFELLSVTLFCSHHRIDVRALIVPLPSFQVDISNSFEMRCMEGTDDIDEAFLQKKMEQCEWPQVEQQYVVC